MLVDVLMWWLAVPVGAAAMYLLVFTLLSTTPRRPRSAARTTRFDVLVPAHDEATVIARTVSSLCALDWPVERFRVRVIADNCTDATAENARAAGAGVLERHDTTEQGKGFALRFGFQASIDEGWADAIVVVDADSVASSNLLAAFAARIAEGESAIQAHFGTLNPHASWRTRLITIAQGAFHIVRSRGRERLGLSCGIRGNGWCVTHELLRKVPYTAYSLAEDVEYGAMLGLAGVRVAYADEAQVAGEMVSTGGPAAVRQRQRWEHGRRALVRSLLKPLLRAAVRRRSALCLDLALDLMVPPLSAVVAGALVLTTLGVLGSTLADASRFWTWCGLTCLGVMAAYVLRGWRLSGVGRAGVVALARAPLFMAWKVIVMLRPRPRAWVRTDREPN